MNDVRDKKYVTKNEMIKNEILATLFIPISEWGFQATSWAAKAERSRDIAFYIPESRPTDREIMQDRAGSLILLCFSKWLS
jgi:hypothetical protein